MSRRARPLLAALAVLVGVVLAAGPAAAQTDLDPGVRAAQVLVVGAPGLRWDDVTAATMPALHALAGRSALGALSVKARPAVSCPADGWLTLGAGSRAEAFGVACADSGVGDRSAQRARNLDTRDAADVDALAAALRQAGACLTAHGPGAEAAAGPAQPAEPTTGRDTRAAGSCPVVLLDGAAVGAAGQPRARGAARVDALVAALDAARAPGSTLLVVGLSGVPGDEQPHLHVALAAGPGFAPGALVSASTRRPPYVQLVDVAPTVLDVVGADRPPSMTGQPWRSTGQPTSPAALADLGARAVAAKRATVPFFVVLVGGLLLALAAAALRRSWPLAELVGLAGVGTLAGSYLAGLLPWWRAPAPTVVLVALAVAAGLGAAAVSRRVPGLLGPAGAVCGLLAGVLVVDLLTGATLQVDTPAGYSPLVAGRFAGIGNVAFGVLAAAVLLALAAATAGRRGRAAGLAVTGGGLLAVVVDGAPAFGSDVGGVLALVPAVAVLAMLRAGVRVSVGRLLLAGLAGVAVVTAFALADAAREPADRTHLGRFVEQVRDGTAGTVLERKAVAVLDLLTANAATAALPLVVAAAVLLVLRPPAPLRRLLDDAAAWRHGLAAVGVAAAVGFAVNDSGPAVPALALLVAAPATVAAVARGARSGAAGR